MRELADFFQNTLGLGLQGNDIGVLQMALRAVIVYVVTLAMVRLGKKRFLGRATAFDIILGIMLGSIVSRAITGNAPFLPTLVSAGILIAMHSLFTIVALHWHGFGTAIKGHPRLLVRDGTIDWKAMRRAHLTERDLMEDLRQHGMTKVEDVAEAWLERNGNISLIRKKT